MLKYWSKMQYLNDVLFMRQKYNRNVFKIKTDIMFYIIYIVHSTVTIQGILFVAVELPLSMVHCLPPTQETSDALCQRSG